MITTFRTPFSNLFIKYIFCYLNPVAYGGIRHYLFLIPLMVYVSTQVIIDISSALKIKYISVLRYWVLNFYTI